MKLAKLKAILCISLAIGQISQAADQIESRCAPQAEQYAQALFSVRRAEPPSVVQSRLLKSDDKSVIYRVYVAGANLVSTQMEFKVELLPFWNCGLTEVAVVMD